MHNRKTITVTIDMVTNQETYGFGTDASFQGKIINRIFAVRKDGKSLNKKTVVSDATGFKSLFIELKADGVVSTDIIPLELVFQKSTQGNCIGYLIDQHLLWTNCKLISYEPATVVTGEVVELVVEFED